MRKITITLVLILTGCAAPSVSTRIPEPSPRLMGVLTDTPYSPETPTQPFPTTPTPTSEPTRTPIRFPTEAPLPTVAVQTSIGVGEVLSSESCQFSVVIPEGWEVVNDTMESWYQDPSVGNCVFGIRPPDWNQIRDESDVSLGAYPIVLVVAFAPAPEVSGLVFLEREGSDWFVLGRQSFRVPAEVSYLKGNLFVRGTGTFGMTTKDTGSYAGLGSAYRALLWDGGRRTAMFEELTMGSEAYLDDIISSFEFK